MSCPKIWFLFEIAFRGSESVSLWLADVSFVFFEALKTGSDFNDLWFWTWKGVSMIFGFDESFDESKTEILMFFRFDVRFE
jgi:hypothetical protein